MDRLYTRLYVLTRLYVFVFYARRTYKLILLAVNSISRTCTILELINYANPEWLFLARTNFKITNEAIKTIAFNLF